MYTVVPECSSYNMTTTPRPTCPAPAPCICRSPSLVSCAGKGLDSKSRMLRNSRVYWNLQRVILHLDMSRNQVATLPDDFLENIKHLVTLNLDDNHFAGPLENQLSNSLVRLLMNRNVIGSDQKAKVGVFLKLEELHLSYNQINRISNTYLKNVPKLKNLVMVGNHISVIGSRAFSWLANLQILNLASNQISTLSKDSFNGLVSLQTLILNNNALEILGNEVFDSLVNLETLDLSHNLIHVLTTRCFEGLGKIQDLKLTDNKLSYLPEGIFEPTTFLSDLYLDKNLLKTLDVDTFKDISKTLRQLDISYNKIHSIACGFFQALVALRKLTFQGPMTLRLPNVTNMHHLQEIDISDGLIKTISPCELQGLNLVRLYWQKVNLPCDCNQHRIKKYADDQDIVLIWNSVCRMSTEEQESCLDSEQSLSDFCDEEASCILNSGSTTTSVSTSLQSTTPTSTVSQFQDATITENCKNASPSLTARPSIVPSSIDILEDSAIVSWTLTDVHKSADNHLNHNKPRYTVSWKTDNNLQQTAHKFGDLNGTDFKIPYSKGLCRMDVCISVTFSYEHHELTSSCITIHLASCSGKYESLTDGVGSESRQGYVTVPLWSCGLAVVGAVLVTLLISALVAWRYTKYRLNHIDKTINASYSTNNQRLEFDNPCMSPASDI